MINHVSLTAVLCPVNNEETIYRNIKVIRNYKNQEGYFISDILMCAMWTRNRQNALFSYKEGSYVAIDGRIETDNDKVVIIVEQLMFLANGNINYIKKEGD